MKISIRGRRVKKEINYNKDGSIKSKKMDSMGLLNKYLSAKLQNFQINLQCTESAIELNHKPMTFLLNLQITLRCTFALYN